MPQTTRPIGALAALVVSSCVALAACGAATRPPPPPGPDRTLRYANNASMLQASNGMRILVLPDANTNLVEVDVRFDAGSADDPEGKAGLAHLVEHLAFQTQPFGADRPTIMAELGATALSYNAYTTWDTTHYTAVAQRDGLDDMVRIALGRLSATCDQLADGVFEREREVVRNEIRQRSSMSGAQLPRLLLEAIYPPDHPYQRMVGGDDEQLASIERADACAFIDAYYAPSRATLIVAGNTTLDEVKQIANRYLGGVRGRQASPRAAIDELRIPTVDLSYDADVEDATAFVVFAMPGRFDTDELAARVFFDRLGTELGLTALGESYVTAAGTAELGGERAPVAVAYVSVRDVADLPKAVSLIQKQAKAVHDDVTATQITIIRERMQAELMAQVDSLVGRGDMFGDYLQFEGTADFVVGDLERLQRITLEGVRAAAERATERSMIVYVKPDPDAAATQTRAELVYTPRTHTSDDWTVPVDPAEARRPLAVPDRVQSSARAKTFTLDNGMGVSLVSSSTIPVIDIRLIFGSGTRSDEADKGGTAAMTAYLLQPRIDTEHLEDLTAAYSMMLTGGWVAASVDAESTTFRVTGMSGYVDRLLAGLERVVAGGTYPDELVKAYRTLKAESLDKSDVEDSARYTRVLAAAVYGEDHPYATATRPTAESIRGIDAGDLSAFKKRHYRASNAFLVIAGNFDVDVVEQHVRWNFEHWSSGEATERAPVEASRRAGGPAYLGIDGDGHAQVSAAIVYPTAVGIDESYGARMVLTAMVNMRMRVVREVLGASYGIDARRSTRHGPGSLVIAGDIDSPRAGEALVAMRAALDDLREGDDAFDSDFVLARRTIVQQLLADRADSASVASELAYIAEFGLPADFYDDLARRVAALTPDDVHALIAAELAPEHETILLAGDRKAIEAAYAAAGVSGVRYLD